MYEAAFEKPQLRDVIRIDGTLETALFAVREARRRAPSQSWKVHVDEDSGEVWAQQDRDNLKPRYAKLGDVLMFAGPYVDIRGTKSLQFHQGLPEPWMINNREDVRDALGPTDD